jgi:hypothetical protein
MVADGTIPSAIACPLAPRHPCPRTRGQVFMSESRFSSLLAVLPSQVWDALTIDNRTRAIQLMACMASNLVTSLDGVIPQEVQPCSQTSPRRRSGANTSTAPR